MADKAPTAASVIASAGALIDRLRKAGETITAGATVYLDATTDTYKLAASNGAAALAYARGIALNGQAVGQPIDVCIEDPDFTPGFTTTVGEVMVLSANAGKLTADAQTSGRTVVVLGLGLPSNKMHLKIVYNVLAVVP